MFCDRNLAGCVWSALDCLSQNPSLPVLALNRNYCIISDFHLGDGSLADNFAKNRDIAEDMLKYYSNSGYYLIINGDFEELWQFSCESVRREYHDFLLLLSTLFRDKIIRIYGNHDASAPPAGLYPGIIIRDKKAGKPILITHGHLGSRESDLYSWFSRLCVRLFRFFEPFCIKIGIIHPPVFKRYAYRHKFEYIHESWARERGFRIICGHSHRAVFASRSYYDKLKEARRHNPNSSQRFTIFLSLMKEIIRHRNVSFKGKPEGVYFNCGCGLYKRGITALEIQGVTIRLVKWEKRGRKVYGKMKLS